MPTRILPGFDTAKSHAQCKALIGKAF